MDINKLKDIKLYCPNEDTNYKDPVKIIDANGNKIYAYVTLIMLGDRYVPAAIVLAQSLIDLNSQVDRVVLITPDVSPEAKELLSKYYDKIIEVNYVTVQNWRTKKQTHRKYLELVFTKFHLFNLTQYKKVLLIDADAIVLKYPDHLFTLDAPAGCFLEDKDHFIYYDKNGDYKMPPETGIEWYNIYCDKLTHGMKVPKEFTDRVLTDFKNSGIGGGLMLLEPKIGEFDEIIKDVSRGKMRYLLENKFVWPEQQYLTGRYSGKWTSINPRFFGLQGYPDWSVLYGLQYGGDKPFMLDSKFDIKIRVSYRDYQLFHDIYRDIIKKNPSFKNLKCLEEVNKLHKHFPENKNNLLKRTNTPNISEDMISKIYRIDKKYISKENLNFYHTIYNKWYAPELNLIEPMFNDIEEYDYMEPIIRLNKNNNSKYYQNLINNYSIQKLKIRLDDLNKIDPIDKDEIMLQYIKCRKNCFMITLWNYGEPISKELIEFLEKKGNVYYVKKLKLDNQELYNLMLQIYDEYTYQEVYTRMKEKLNWMKTSDENTVTVIVFDNINKLKLAGQGALFKRELRDFCIKKLNEKKHDTKDIKGNDLIHVNDYFYQSIEYAGLYFNQNSLKLLKYFNPKNFFSNFFIRSHLKYNTLRKWFYNNLGLENLNRVCLLGSVCLYTHGIRNMGDIDGIYLANIDNILEPELIEQLNTSFSNKSTKIDFADMGIKNSKYWKDSWESKNKKVLDYFNISSFDDVVYNPKYHYNFHGIKIYLIDYELVRKIYRLDKNQYDNREQYYIKQSAKDYTDFIMMYFNHRLVLGHYMFMDEKNKLKINTDFKIKDIELENISEENKNTFIKTIFDNLERYSKEESQEINKEIIIKLF